MSQSSRKQHSAAQINTGRGQSQYALQFKTFDAEEALAQGIFARTGRNLFAGVTDPKDRQAAARIAIILNKLQGEFGERYERIYGEALPTVKRLEQPQKEKEKQP